MSENQVKIVFTKHVCGGILQRVENNKKHCEDNPAYFYYSLSGGFETYSIVWNVNGNVTYYITELSKVDNATKFYWRDICKRAIVDWCQQYPENGIYEIVVDKGTQKG